MAYHTGLATGKIEGADPVSIYKHGDSIAFQLDILNEYPEIYSECEVIYGEPPWPKGTKVFDERVGITSRHYTDLYRGVSELIESLSIPIYLVAGSWGHKYLPRPDAFGETYIKGPIGDCTVFAYNAPLPQFENGIGPLPYLVQEYDVIGDWFCGYGNTALEAHRQGKRFIVSDYNAECIGYIKTAFEGLK